MIIVDTSVAVKWSLKEPGHEQALEILDFDEPRAAPDLIFSELANVMRKKIVNGDASPDQARSALIGVEAVIPLIVPSRDLAQDALILAQELNHSAYDCFYLACALGRGVMVSADEKFIAKCKAQKYSASVASLDDVSSGRLSALLSMSSVVGSGALETVARLAPLMEAAFETLEEKARSPGAERFQFIDAGVYGAGFESPAYKRLEQFIDQSPVSDLSKILALGWLGRREHNSDEWQILLLRAGEFIGSDAKIRKDYIMAQMSNVPIGFRKLQQT